MLEHSSGQSSDIQTWKLASGFGFEMTVGNVHEFWVRKLWLRIIKSHRYNYTAIVIVLYYRLHCIIYIINYNIVYNIDW